MSKHDCNYCEETFDDEAAYLDHLESAHYNELGKIDQRRIAGRSKPTGGDGYPPIVYYGAAASILLIAFGGLLFMITSLGGTDERIHEHGTLEVTIDGEAVDFGQPQYTMEGENENSFHFHAGDDEVWHLHPRRQSLAQSMSDLGFELTDSSITIEGETYDDTDSDTTVSVMVNGEEVSPDYELEGVEPVHEARQGAGDDIEILVEAGA